MPLKDEWGGVEVAEQDEFGGVAVDEADEFGGIPVEDEPAAEPQSYASPAAGIFNAPNPGFNKSPLADPFQDVVIPEESLGTYAKEAAMSPLDVAGRFVNAGASDLGAAIGTTAAGRPDLMGEQGGNLLEFFKSPLEQQGPTPQQKVLADISASNPVAATAGKIAGGVVSSAPMIALMPQGAFGKLVAAGFTADMLSHAPDAARRLGEEMGKPESERNMDNLTTAISDLAQTAAFAPLAGAHAGGKAIGERVAPKREAIRELANQLKREPMDIPTTVRRGEVQPRQLGIRIPEGEFAQPEIDVLANRALQEGPNPVLDRGQLPAIEQIRRELNPPRMELTEPTRVAERPIERRGALADRGPQPLRTAEETMMGRTVSKTELPTNKPLRPEVEMNNPLKTSVEILTERLKNKDFVKAVDELSKQPAEVQRAAVDEVTGVGKKKVDLSAAERTIFNELWDKVYQDSLGRGSKPSEALSVAEAPRPTTESVLELSPEKYFEQSQQWARDSMAGKGEPVQIQAELAALRDPVVSKWKEGYAKAAQEAAAVKAEVQANPASMGDPAVQKRFGGAAQKAQFFQEGLKVLEGTEPNARTKAAMEREQALRTAEPKTTEISESIPLRETAAEVSKFETEFPGAPKINIAPDFSAMPKTAQDLALSVGSDPRLIEAYVRGGEVWLNAGAITSPAMVKRLALHETGGHWAVDAKLGKGLQRFMEQTHDSWATSETMKSVLERYPNADKITLGREFIARLSENPMLAPKVWDRIVAQFRQWLRDAGFVKKVTENDIQALISGAVDGMRKVERGEATGEGMLSLKSAAEKANERFPDETAKVGEPNKAPNTVDAIKALKSQYPEDVIRRAFADYQRARFGMDMEKTSPGVKSASLALFAKEVAAGNKDAIASINKFSKSKTATESLDDIYKIFDPEKKTSPTLKERGVQIAEAFRTGVSSKFRPVNKLAEDIAKSYGRTSPKDIAGIMEQLKGSQGKGESDVFRFDRDVSKLVEGSEKDFNAYMFLRRSLDRLNQDAADIATAQAGGNVPKLNRRSVAGYTINSLTPKLEALEAKLGPEKLKQFEDAAVEYQGYMNDALGLQVESGRMSVPVYQAIKEGNQFYAPFKVMKYLEESSKPAGSGKRIDTTADFTKAMEGIEDPNFKLGDMLGAARQGILMSRILADKNTAMRNVAELAAFDTQGQFIKKLAPTADAPRGFEVVNVFESGKQNRYAVRPEVAEAIQLYGGNAGGVISRALGYSSIPFRAGATALNIPFQISNLLADQPRAALISKYGLRGVSDMVKYPFDFVHSLFASIGKDVFGINSKAMFDFLDSGVAGTTIQEYLTPNALKFQEPTNISKSKKLASSVINTLPRFAQAIEQTSKVLGVKRAIRFEGVTDGKQLAKQVPEAITELRRFSGSPDFGRQGKWVEQARLNLLYMFLNARIQGAVADVGRLAGRDSAATAAQTWVKIGTAVGIPTAYLYYLNQRPEFKEDYDKRPEQEKRNYWLIPKDNFITNDDGEKMRDYWRIPKREVSKWMANLTETALDFAQKRDPNGALEFGASMIEELSPVNIQGDTAQERLESVAASLNPLLKAPLELASGRDLYRHRAVVPESMKEASPEEQYTPRTAEAFKKLATMMPDVAPEFLRSPLLLENLTRNLTAGLITQFLPRKPIEGRSGIENNPLLARFQALPYTDNTKFQEQIDSLKREAADEQLTRHRLAVKLMDENKGQPFDKLMEKAPKEEKLLRHLIDLHVAEQNGITAKERQLLALPTKQRAAYVVNQLKGLTPEQKNEVVLNLARKRILTEAVFQDMAEIEQ